MKEEKGEGIGLLRGGGGGAGLLQSICLLHQMAGQPLVICAVSRSLPAWVQHIICWGRKRGSLEGAGDAPQGGSTGWELLLKCSAPDLRHGKAPGCVISMASGSFLLWEK